MTTIIDTNITLTFGKYSGKKLSECPITYVEWLAAQPTICGKKAVPNTASAWLATQQQESNTETTLSPKFIEKIETWAAFMGKDMAVRQYTRLYAMSGLETFFGESEIEMNAQISARGQAAEYRVPQAQYAEWEKLFVEQYSAGYRKAVAEWKERKA